MLFQPSTFLIHIYTINLLIYFILNLLLIIEFIKRIYQYVHLYNKIFLLIHNSIQLIIFQELFYFKMLINHFTFYIQMLIKPINFYFYTLPIQLKLYFQQLIFQFDKVIMKVNICFQKFNGIIYVYLYNFAFLNHKFYLKYFNHVDLLILKQSFLIHMFIIENPFLIIKHDNQHL